MFADQLPANTTTTPVADNVRVLSASWNGSLITVTATNTSGCAALSATYNGNTAPGGFSGSPCTATFPGIPYNAAVPTLSVATSNAEGLSVTGYRITTP